MNETTLQEILEEICAEQVSEYERLKAPYHFFSLRHRKAMKEILYPHHLYQPVEISSKHKYIPIRKRLLIITMIIVAAVLCGTAGGAMSRGFNRRVYPDRTMLLAVNAENCPKTIENVYYLPEIPEGYELNKTDSTFRHIFKSYKNSKTNRSMTFSQDIKDGYKHNFNTEHQDFEELNINGHYALYLNFSNLERFSGTIIWDNGDYIMQITGDFTKDELNKLAESTKI